MYIECVPNVSEGRDPATVEALTRAIQAVAGVALLHTDVGEDAHRTVFTFAGNPAAVTEAAFQLIRTAAARIDMRQHRGAHPRIGATDVCPLVPLEGITLDETAIWADRLAERVGRELGIPVYLYEAYARRPARRNLATIRAGEYEGLAEKMQQPDWQPDYGPATFPPRSGATVIGARPFLLAWNINLATADATIAAKIAARLRESGYTRADGIRVPGQFPALKALGWYMEEFGCAQISCNVTDVESISLKAVYEAADAWARQYGTRVAGSELIGMMPLAVALRNGRAFAGAEADEATALRALVEGLGLDAVRPFALAEKIIEYRMAALAP